MTTEIVGINILLIRSPMEFCWSAIWLWLCSCFHWN